MISYVFIYILYHMLFIYHYIYKYHIPYIPMNFRWTSWNPLCPSVETLRPYLLSRTITGAPRSVKTRGDGDSTNINFYIPIPSYKPLLTYINQWNGVSSDAPRCAPHFFRRFLPQPGLHPCAGGEINPQGFFFIWSGPISKCRWVENGNLAI